MITGIDFIAVPVQDMARARSFYEDKLGLKASSIFGEDFTEYDLGGTTLALGNVAAMGMTFAPVTTGMVALGVADVRQAADQLRAKGLNLDEKVTDSGVCYMVMFQDSEGNALVLHHRYAPENA
jgi:predicted enzyme related to lactoylglutathione lyase